MEIREFTKLRRDYTRKYELHTYKDRENEQTNRFESD